MYNEETSPCEHFEKPDALYDPAIPSSPPFALIGRGQELAHIKQQLQSRGNAALTLHGLPGIGKTSLAITLAHDPEIRETFSDGILWVGVGPNPNLPSLLSRWASLVGISSTQMSTLKEIEEWAFAIRNAIGTRKMLLIIDDVWHFEEVQALRVGAHNCAYLITTRSRDIAAHLALDGAMLIEELNAEQSIQLLTRVAQGVGNSTFSDLARPLADVGVGLAPVHDLASASDQPVLNDANYTHPCAVTADLPSISSLVQTVGGLPLALTLLGNYLSD